METLLSSPLLVAGLAVVSVFLLSAGILGMLGGDGRVSRLRERINSLDPTARHKDEARKATPFDGMSKVVETLGEKLGPKDDEDVTRGQMRLIQAGIRRPNAAGIFQGVKVLGTLFLAGAALAIRMLFFEHLSMVWSIVMVLGPAVVGCYGPEIWINSLTKKRKERMSNELPDALDLLVVCVESGMGLDQAIHRVSTELFRSAPLLSRELKTLTLQLRAGKPRQEALRELSQRVGLDDLNSLCTLLIQADIFGISVSKTLRVYSDVLRTNRYQRAEEKAAKLPVKLLFPLIIFILPALFVAIMGPAGIRMMDVLGSMK